MSTCSPPPPDTDTVRLEAECDLCRMKNCEKSAPSWLWSAGLPAQGTSCPRRTVWLPDVVLDSAISPFSFTLKG
jgi:hypothetical protein